MGFNPETHPPNGEAQHMGTRSTKVVQLSEYSFRIQAVRLTALLGGLLCGICAGATSHGLPLFAFLSSPGGKAGCLIIGAILLFASLRLTQPKWTDEATVLKLDD